jgi:hypothetical protein
VALAEARAAMVAPAVAPPVDAVIHDIAAADDIVPTRFDYGGD